MTEKYQQIMELYKLHAELADRVSQRREGANRLYVGVLTTFLSAVLILIQITDDNSYISAPTLFGISGAIGVCICVAWYIVIRSYRQLNGGKFAALLELEEQLPYPFFEREWEFLKKGDDFRTYWKLTVVETILPLFFGLLYIGLLIYGLTLVFK